MRVLVLLVAALIAYSSAKTFSYANCLLLSESKVIRFYWTVDGANINGAIEGQSNGYLSWGLSKTGGMMETDAYLIASNANATDKCYSGSANGGCFADLYIPNYSITWDDKQSLDNVKVGKDGSQMWGTFTRKLDTGDSKDYALTKDSQYKINFAASDKTLNYGETGSYHNTYGASKDVVNFFATSTCPGVTPAPPPAPPAPATTGAKPAPPAPATTGAAKPAPTPAAATTGAAKPAPTPAAATTGAAKPNPPAPSSTGVKPFPVPEVPLGENTIKSMGFLLAGQKLWEPKKAYFLSNDQDGDLVIYRNNTNPATPVMATGTKGKGPCVFVIQNDGNLVLYGGVDQHRWRSVWASGTYGKGMAPYYLSMESDALVLTDSKNTTVYRADFTKLGAELTLGGSAEDGAYELDDPFGASSAATAVLSVALLVIAALF